MSLIIGKSLKSLFVMKNKNIMVFIFLLAMMSCSHNGFKTIANKLESAHEMYHYTDKNGHYVVEIQSGMNLKDHTYVVKKTLELPNKRSDGILEQSITVSEIGMLKNKTPILRPKISQYSVWFEGKKYFSEMKINPKKKLVELKMQSPEEKFNGSKQFAFPTTKGVTCFFSQIIDCLKVNGVIEKMISKKGGKISFFVIWEGYPFLNDTYADFPSELFSEAEIEFDGSIQARKKKNQVAPEFRFNLGVAGQSLFYLLDEHLKLKKMFWVSQGISMTDDKEIESSADSFNE